MSLVNIPSFAISFANCFGVLSDVSIIVVFGNRQNIRSLKICSRFSYISGWFMSRLSDGLMPVSCSRILARSNLTLVDAVIKYESISGSDFNNWRILLIICSDPSPSAYTPTSNLNSQKLSQIMTLPSSRYDAMSFSVTFIIRSNVGSHDLLLVYQTLFSLLASQSRRKLITVSWFEMNFLLATVLFGNNLCN